MFRHILLAIDFDSVNPSERVVHWAASKEVSFSCTSCREIRPGEGLLSHVEARPNGEAFRVCDQMCMRCVRSDPAEDM